MSHTERFGAVLALVALVALVAVLSNRLTARIRVPAPALFLLGAAVASDLFPALRDIPVGTVEQIVTVALVLVLFDGGMHIGWGRLRRAAGAVVWIGIAGTLVTAAAAAVLCHVLFGLDWRISMLIGTALAPTDPAVVFSVLGRREIVGRSGTLLEGESGANDPVGIALLVSILAAGGAGGLSAVGTGVLTFVEQMVIGAGVGVLGGVGLRWFIRRVALPSEALYPLRTLAAALVIYGAATVAHGSGFLAVFIAGIVIGDVRAPFKAEVTRFHSAVASMGEIVAFIALGLTVSLRTLPDGDAWQVGLALAVLLAFLVRPLLVGLLLLPIQLTRGERFFVLWSGLKGAVPILLGTFIITAGLHGTTRVYDIIFVVVAFSVIVQGGLVPLIGRRCGVPMRMVDPKPWALGMRFSDEPGDLHTLTVGTDSPADDSTPGALARDHHAWVSFIRRRGRFVPVRPDTTLHAGDEVLVNRDYTDVDDADNPFTATPSDP